MDNLSYDMIQCEKDGFGCHYGAWKALQPVVRVKRVLPEELDNGLRICEVCGTEFYYYGKGKKRLCSKECRDKRMRRSQQLYYERKKERKKNELSEV